MTMSIEQAKKNIGEKVTYQAYAFAPEEIGTITEVRGPWIFVNYGDLNAKATSPAQLTLMPKIEIKKENNDG